MQRGNNDAQLVKERYLAGQLSPEQEATFEERYLHDPELVEELAVGQRFLLGLRRVAREERTNEGRMMTEMSPKPESRMFTLVNALAVLVIVAIPIVWLFRDMDTIEERLDEVLVAVNRSTPPVNLPIFSLQPLRGATPTPFRLNLANATGWIVLSLETASLYDEYRVNLQSDAGEEIWSHEGLVPDYIGALVFALPAGMLADGDYQAVTEGKDADGTWQPASTFRFAVVREP